MSDAEAEPIHLGLVFEPIPDSPTVPVTVNEGSRKRSAGERPTDVPSASRRRRMTNPDSASFMRPSFPSTCCLNGIVQPPMPACLLQSSQAFEHPGATSSSASSLPPIYRPQVIAPQVHAQMAAMPSTSNVNNLGPVTLHVHTPPIVLSNYPSSYVQLSQNRANAYYLNQGFETPRISSQGVSIQQANSTPLSHQHLLGLRLPATPMTYTPRTQQDAPQPGFTSSPNVSGAHRPPELAYTRHGQQVAANNQWDIASINSYGGQVRSFGARDPNSRIELLLSRVRQVAAQVAAQAAVDTTAELLAAHHSNGGSYGDSSLSSDIPSLRGINAHNRIDGPVAIPTWASEWARRRGAHSGPISGFANPELSSIANGDIPFRAWEAAVLQIFDRIPHMNLMRLPPKGMPKSEIEQLRSFRLVDPAVLMEKVCVVCQCEFEKRDHIRVLPCDHHYHVKCVDKWLKTNRTCPICRQSASKAIDVSQSRSPSSAPQTPHIAVQVITQLGAASPPSALSPTS